MYMQFAIRNTLKRESLTKKKKKIERTSSRCSPPIRDPRASKRHCDLVIINKISDYYKK